MKKSFLISLVFIFGALCFAEDLSYENYEPNYLYKKEYNIIKNISETIRLIKFQEAEGYELITLTDNNITNTGIIYNIMCGNKEKIYALLFELESLDKSKATYADYLENKISNNEDFSLAWKNYDLEDGFLTYSYMYY